MTGTIVNTIAVIIGGVIGLCLKNGLKENYKTMITSVMGMSVLFIGMSTALGGLLSGNAEDILFIVSLVIGSILGEYLKIEDKLEGLGDLLQSKLGHKGGNVSQGFVIASLTYCVGTMAILGSIESGIQGQHTILYIKSLLDGVMAIVFASTLGIGVVFSAVSIFVYQGILTMLATYIEPFVTEAIMIEISIVGGIMVFAIGCNLLEIKKFKIGNMLPAIIVPVIYFLPPVEKFFKSILSFI